MFVFSDIKSSIENDLELLKSQNHPSIVQVLSNANNNPMVAGLMQRL